MRKGFTTGSCSAAAAKAATFMLFTRVKKDNISIMTPAGINYTPDLCEVVIEDNFVSCGVIKDGGDDPDSTSGALICAKVSFSEKPGVHISGGIGVGKITRPGLEMPVGEAAINSTPRRMITGEVEEVLKLFDYQEGVEVEIFVPEGAQIAKKTFNPHMGIVDGISILGTTGIVEPMSNEALIKTIELDLRQKKAEGDEVAIMVPGNYGETFLKNNYGVDPKKVVHFSNFVGVAVDLAKEIGFKKIIMVGHTGKLVKVSGGIMNTHSHEADSRLELMAAAVIKAAHEKGIVLTMDFLEEILACATTTAALDIIDGAGYLKETSEVLLSKILFHLRKRGGEDLDIQCILYENSYGLLAKSDFAEDYL